MQVDTDPNDAGSSSAPTSADYTHASHSPMNVHSPPSTTINPHDQGQVVYGNVYSSRHHSGPHHEHQHQHHQHQQHQHQHHQHQQHQHQHHQHQQHQHQQHQHQQHQHQQHQHQQHQHQQHQQQQHHQHQQHQDQHPHHQQHQHQQHNQHHNQHLPMSGHHPQHHSAHGASGGHQHHSQSHSMGNQHHQHQRSHGGSLSIHGSPHAAYSMNLGNPIMSGRSSMGPGPSQRTVMMVYGLHPEQVNCDRLFNLFCLYGNVIRIKFLKTKEGCAMVQMGDAISVERCIGSLNKIMLFRNELQIQFSRQTFLHDVVNVHTLPDGSPSFKDFMNNKNNRFKNPEVACKNRILPPSPVLHFFNAPLGVTEESLMEIFRTNADCEPETVKIFAPKSENVKSNSGLLTFGDSAEATSALVLCNHLSLVKPGSPNPYTLRLCFSPPTYVRNTV